jgi:leucine dehydrogenase
MGGFRLKGYSDDVEAATEDLDLGRAMTHKSVHAHQILGGGKVAVRTSFNPKDPDYLEQKHVIQQEVTKVLEQLQVIVTAVDMNTSDADVLLMGLVGPHTVAGAPSLPYGGRSASPETARGIILGMRATAEVKAKLPRHSHQPLAGKRVSQQGMGGVGLPQLRSLLREEGVAKVWATDADAAVRQSVREEFSKEIAEGRLEILENLDSIYDQPADIFSPTAVAHVLNEQTVPRLMKAGVTMIVGAANAPLDSPRIGRMLHDAGILFAVDWVINSGGLQAVEIDLSGMNLKENIERIYDTTYDVLERAVREDVPTSEMADRMAEEEEDRLEAQDPSEHAPQAQAELALLSKGPEITDAELAQLIASDLPWWTKELAHRTARFTEWELMVRARYQNFLDAFLRMRASHQRYVAIHAGLHPGLDPHAADLAGNSLADVPATAVISPEDSGVGLVPEAEPLVQPNGGESGATLLAGAPEVAPALVNSLVGASVHGPDAARVTERAVFGQALTPAAAASVLERPTMVSPDVQWVVLHADSLEDASAVDELSRQLNELSAVYGADQHPVHVALVMAGARTSDAAQTQAKRLLGMAIAEAAEAVGSGLHLPVDHVQLVLPAEMNPNDLMSRITAALPPAPGGEVRVQVVGPQPWVAQMQQHNPEVGAYAFAPVEDDSLAATQVGALVRGAFAAALANRKRPDDALLKQLGIEATNALLTVPQLELVPAEADRLRTFRHTVRKA